MNDIRLARYLSYLLRHSPQSLDLKIDEEGYVFVNELIEKVNSSPKHKDTLNQEVLDRIVATDDKGRFSYNKDKTKIRAVQGHSFHVDVAVECVPPKVLYHGTSKSAYELIKCDGIKKITRDYVHLSEDIPTAVSVGMRHAKTVGNLIVLSVDTQKMTMDGHKFYIAENGVWLADYVPPQYLSVYNME